MIIRLLSRSLMKSSFVLVMLSLWLTGCANDSEEWSEVTVKQVDIAVKASGELGSAELLTINPPMVSNMWQYKIQFMVPEGSMVKKGQRLVSFDSSQLQQQLRVKQSELDKAEKNLESTQLNAEQQSESLKLALAEKNMNRDKAKRKWEQSDDLVSSVDIKQLKLDYQLSLLDVEQAEFQLEHYNKEADTKYKVTQNDVERLQNDVERLKREIQRMTVVAPKSGMVIYTSHNGEKPVVGSSIWQGRSVMEIPSMEKMIVKADIDEVDAKKIALGQLVEIKIDAISDQVFTGKITKLGQVYRPKSHDVPSVVFDAEVMIDNPNTELMRPGMSARLSIFVNSYEKAITVPSEAIYYDNDTAFVTVDGLVGKEQRTVVVGPLVGDEIVVLSGLQEKERVLL
ncbi:efflux RND transporter periplasmic adaptor subunit [Pleionea sediminis]|uniref:efflux RND transporter periplasmic adaptor subunit n=1 Tax=Pleionea sediminis TaxID=2569479 RepID=UPI0011857410|nr:efflux RND transporter periplasmic adaptor subunit [Pleionea sediminis]